MHLVELHTRLSKAECEERLRERIRGIFVSYTTVYGSVAGSQFWIEQKIGYRNSFKTRLCGDVFERRGETVISCRIGLPPVLLAGAAAYFVILTMVMASMWLALGTVPRALPVMIFGGAGILAVGRYLAKDEGDALLQFVRANLEASPRNEDRQHG